MQIIKRFFLVLILLSLCLVALVQPVYAAEGEQELIALSAEEVEEKEEEPVRYSIYDLLMGHVSETEWCDIFAYYRHVSGQDKVPLYNQRDYPHTPYGDYGTVSSHGCGIACLSMVATYLTGSPDYDIETLAEQFGNYNTEHGSYWILFEDSAEVLGLDFQERTYSWKTVMEALENGQVVIALQGEGLFTSGGHYIVLTGLTEDGKIMVNDPNGNNWNKNRTMRYGFENGFTEEQVKADGGPYWIYGKKDIPNIEIIGGIDMLTRLIESQLSYTSTVSK